MMLARFRLLAAVASFVFCIDSANAAPGDEKINGGRDTSTTPATGTVCKPVPADYGLEMAKTWVAAHKASHPDWKYVYIAPEVVTNNETLNLHRVAVLKIWNSLSFTKTIDLGEDASDGHCLVRALNPQAIWANAATENWGYISNATPKRNIAIAPAPVGSLKAFTADENALVSSGRFVFNASNGGPYANVMATPPDYKSFLQKYPLSPVVAASAHTEAIVCGPRMTGWRTVQVNGVSRYYAGTSDEFSGRSGAPAPYRDKAPTENESPDFAHGSFIFPKGDTPRGLVSEWWMQLPNGMLYYGIHGEAGQERGTTEKSFAVDPANWAQNGDLATGRSCFTCHVNGVQAAASDYAGQNGWTSAEELRKLYDPVRTEFRAAMQQIVAAVADRDVVLNDAIVNGVKEPISRAIALIEGPFAGSNPGCETFCPDKNGKSKFGDLCSKLPLR